MIRTDTATTILIVCDDCPSWRRHATTRLEARRIAAEHEEALHPAVHTARQAFRLYARRLAAQQK